MATTTNAVDAVLEKLPKILREAVWYGVEWREECTSADAFRRWIEPLLKELDYPLPESMTELKKKADEMTERENRDDTEEDNE